MKPIPEIVDCHLAFWYATPPGHTPPTPTLRDRCIAMIVDALAQADQLDDDTVYIPLVLHNKVVAELADLKERFSSRGADILRLQGELSDMRAARDDAVIAAHLIRHAPTTPAENKL